MVVNRTGLEEVQTTPLPCQLGALHITHHPAIFLLLTPCPSLFSCAHICLALSLADSEAFLMPVTRCSPAHTAAAGWASPEVQ
jgi:hypothetical protein